MGSGDADSFPSTTLGRHRARCALGRVQRRFRRFVHRPHEHGAADRRHAADFGDARRRLFVHAHRVGSKRRRAAVRYRRETCLGVVQQGDRSAHWHAGRRRCRDLSRDRHLGDGRQERHGPAGIRPHRSGPGGRGEPCSDHQRHPRANGCRRRGLHLYTHRERCRRQQLELHDPEPARVGGLRPDDRHATRVAAVSERRYLREHRNRRYRRQRDRVAAPVHARRHDSDDQLAADDLGRADDVRSGGHTVHVRADGRRPR